MLVTEAPISRSLASLLMEVHVVYVARATRLEKRDKKRVQPQAREELVLGVHVPTESSSCAQRWSISINVPLGLDTLMDVGFEMCGNATVYDIYSLESLLRHY